MKNEDYIELARAAISGNKGQVRKLLLHMADKTDKPKTGEKYTSKCLRAIATERCPSAIRRKQNEIRLAFGAKPCKNLDLRQAAKVLTISPETMRKYCRERGAPGHKEDGRWYFSKKELFEWVKGEWRGTAPGWEASDWPMSDWL